MSFKQVYDLVFRARNARLSSSAYVLDYFDWVKAGVAFNTRGYDVSSRKISYFAGLYNMFQRYRGGEDYNALQSERASLEQSLQMYYEDIFEIYQDHLKSKQAEVGLRKNKTVPDFGDIIVIPGFDKAPELRELFETKVVDYSTYECQNLDTFLQVVNSIYLKHDSALFKCMSLLYDYGKRYVEGGVLLEVKLWDSEK